MFNHWIFRKFSNCKKITMEEIGNQMSQIQPLNKSDIIQSPLGKKKPILEKYLL
jgi:hypothetical protein